MFEILLALVPLLLLVVSLLLGCYPGCEAIVRLSERIAMRRHHRVASRQPRPVAPARLSASGGLLIAFGLAQRPPPLAP
jgi:folate-binding Fe-S cluster repair protein YgfZ